MRRLNLADYKALATSMLLLNGHFLVDAQRVVAQTSVRPNLLIIMTDEHSIRTLGCYRQFLNRRQAYMWGANNNVETPNLDRLASQGAICTHFYSSSPVSTPARASFQTGLYPSAAGAPINEMAMDANCPSFAEVLKDEGYKTSYVGKWHLGGTPKLKNRHYYAPGYAFGWMDRRYMFESDHQKWYTQGSKPEYVYITNNTPENPNPDMYSTDYLTNKAIEILERDKNSPFCLMLSIPDPHSPDKCREPYVSFFKKMTLTQPETMSPELIATRPKWAVGGKSEADRFVPANVQNYFAMVKCIDDNVGKILDYLDKSGLAKNTIVVFTADHGDMLYNHKRVDKGNPYDDAARVPFIIRYPGHIKTGKVIQRAYNTTDFVPTILGLMNAKQIEGVHGINDARTFVDKRLEVKADRLVYFTDSPFTTWTAITDGRYKLVLSCCDTPWLFDMEKDPMEIHNFYGDSAYKTIQDRLQKALIEKMKTYDDPALKLKRPFLYSATDTVSYVSPYKGLNRKEIMAKEKQTLDAAIYEMQSEYYRNY